MVPMRRRYSYIPAMLIPLATTAFAIETHCKVAWTAGLAVLVAVSLVVVLSHRRGFLQFRAVFLSMYCALFLLGLAGVWVLPRGACTFAARTAVLGLGISPLLIPGIGSRICRAAGSLRHARDPGVCEGVSLLITQVPLQAAEAWEAFRHPLTLPSKTMRLLAILRGDIVIGPIYAFVRLMHRLAAATIARRFTLRSYHPAVQVSCIETTVYTTSIGLLLCLAAAPLYS